MEVNGLANIISIVQLAQLEEKIDKDVAERIIQQSKISIEYFKKYFDNNQITWHEVRDGYLSKIKE